MDYNFEIWQKALDDFKASVSKDLEEIRQHKEEVQQLKTELYTAMNKGYYLRDDIIGKVIFIAENFNYIIQLRASGHIFVMNVGLSAVVS